MSLVNWSFNCCWTFLFNLGLAFYLQVYSGWYWYGHTSFLMPSDFKGSFPRHSTFNLSSLVILRVSCKQGTVGSGFSYFAILPADLCHLITCLSHSHDMKLFIFGFKSIVKLFFCPFVPPFYVPLFLCFFEWIVIIPFNLCLT